MKLIRDRMLDVPWKCEELKKYVRGANDYAEEAADVYEVVLTICADRGWTQADLHQATLRKKEVRGGFVHGRVLDI